MTNPDNMEQKAIEDEGQQVASDDGMPEAPYVDPSVQVPEGEAPDTGKPKVQFGLHPFGVTVTVNPMDGGPPATVILNLDEAFLYQGQLQSLGTFFMHAGIHQQIAQNAEVQQMMAAQAAPGRKSSGGVYLK